MINKLKQLIFVKPAVDELTGYEAAKIFDSHVERIKKAIKDERIVFEMFSIGDRKTKYIMFSGMKVIMANEHGYGILMIYKQGGYSYDVYVELDNDPGAL